MIKVGYPEYTGVKICRAKLDVRYYLNGFLFDKEGFIVATDGHRMFVAAVNVDSITDDVIVDVKGKAPNKFAYALFNIEEKSVSFRDDKDNLLCTLPLEIVDGRYPGWRRVATVKEGKVSQIGLNFDYLADAAKVGKAFGTKNNAYAITLQDAASAVQIKYSDSAYMIIMPCRT